MKIDIWITTDDGAEYHTEDLNWSEACAIIIDKHNQEKLFNLLNNEIIKDYIKELQNENNEN